MSLISFEKPKKVKPIYEWKDYSFDGGPAGGYVPNMSDEDMKRWKGKHFKGYNERIEIHKSFPMAQIVIVVRKHPPIPVPDKKLSNNAYDVQRKLHHEQKNNIKISMNGSLWLSTDEWAELTAVVAEAQSLLKLFSL